MDLGEFLWTMFAFFFWFMFIWMFIVAFGDIFRRDDLTGWGKAGWILLLVFLPFLGLLIYSIARPTMTDQDRRLAAESQERTRRASGYSAADEIAKIADLHAAGELTTEQYEAMKSRALADV